MRFPLRDTVAVAAGALAPFAAALVLMPFRTSVTHTNLALLLVVVVVAVSALGNRWAGALAALSAVAWFDFFHTEPYQSFHIQDRADVETAVLLLVVGVIVSQLAARGRTLERVAVTDASYLERLHGTTRLVRFSTSSDDIVRRVRQELTEVLELRACRFEGGQLTGRPPRLEPDGSVKVAGWIWDLEWQGWPDGEIELRAIAYGRYQGRFMMTPAPGSVPPPLEARLVAVDLASQAAAALDDDGVMAGSRP
ncbi:PAS domain-containing sensor histidine kinase [Streptomyces sp. NBC_01381]|uniref:DUF4118 domain-containing protein n=1 Tax=Streptomyces sp. NBC_01381 TaxID=2903845 RepID=UPI0022542060|nr:DUF4118 domain-containing protein [Streptomyces sp. NBC_01381]MCX4671171.1 PAS domain-containing sensor histidine kinase [Streptomyces sp. NBC_01381]